MKQKLIFFIIFFTSINIFAQTKMKIITTDGNLHTYFITDIDSIYYTEPSPFNCGDQVSDYDGNTYGTIQIGNQCWFIENLKTTHFSNGDEIINVTDVDDWQDLGNNNTGKAYCWYNNDISNKDIYGALYTYATATNGDNSGSSVQGICPDGWHLPSKAEFETLANFVGENPAPKLAGNASLWEDGGIEDSPNFGTSGFNALPGGLRIPEFMNIGVAAYFWTNTEESETNAHWFRIVNNNNNITLSSVGKVLGQSVRCVKD